jgi:hypothetical protein
MKYKLSLTTLFLISVIIIKAQTSLLVVNPTINLPKDSVESLLLTSTLNEFLIAARKPNEENKLVLSDEKVETYILLDEMNGIEKSGKFKSDTFYKPYLTNVVGLNDKSYLLQVSYIGVNDNVPYLRASFELIANKLNNTFYYSSTLKRNTQNWKVLTMNNCTFHYKESINKTIAKEYQQKVALFDSKLKLVNKTTELYCCDDYTELRKLLGIEYKSDYNGRQVIILSSVVADKTLVLLGTNKSQHFDDYEKHDLWHNRLSLAISRSLVNNPIDEGCAFLYGGSWGLSWKEIVKQFKTKVASDKKADWANYKENPKNFADSETQRLMVDYVVNALIVQKIEKEKGFSGVWEFLNCGKYEKGNENYYKALEKIAGISGENYNTKVWELIIMEK